MRAGLLAAVAALACAAPAGAQDWTPADRAPIRPGVQLLTDGAQCTANFVFVDAADVYIGYAAHCARARGTGSATDTSSYCRVESLPLGTAVQVTGATRPGRLAYSSWTAMIAAQEEDIGACNNNDFALVRLDPADRARVNPTVPFWGGPTGLRRTLLLAGEKVLSYGNSGLRRGIEELKPKEGYLVAEHDDGWTHWVYFATPGIFGDSGSGAFDAAGSAMGVLVTLNTLTPGGNGVTDLGHAVDYMRSHGGPQARLALGTEPFRGPLLGPGAADPPPPTPDPTPAPSPPPEPTPSPQPPPAAPSGGGQTPAGSSKPAAKPKKRTSRKTKKKRCRKARSKRRSANARKAPKCRKPAPRRRRR